MPFETDQQERVWCPGPWPWEWFDTCIRTRHKWCYNFSWVKGTAYAVAVYYEGCEAGRLFTWWEFGLGIGDQGTFTPASAMCFDSARSSGGNCDSSNTGLAASGLTADQQQGDWRYCRKCHSMFFDGYTNKGVCPGDDLKLMVVSTPTDLAREGRHQIVAGLVGSQLHVRIFDGEGKRIVDKAEHELVQGKMLTDLKEQLTRESDHSTWLEERKQKFIAGLALVIGDMTFPVTGHVAAGLNFLLPHDVPESTWAQQNWRYCQKCHMLFFDGYPDKGVCPGGGGHFAAGFNFVVPHDVAPSGPSQANWRYCHKCHTMFFDGYANKGVCAASGGHSAAGFNFVVTHT